MATKKKQKWFTLIDKAEKRGEFTEAERRQARSWQTCACGTQGKFFQNPNALDGEPWDDHLFELGAQFGDDVEQHDFKAARKTMTAIEKRAQYLYSLFNGNQKAVNYMLSGQLMN